MKKIVLGIIIFGFTLLMADNNYTLEKLNKEIQNSSKPTIVYFRKKSCISCKELESLILVDKKVQKLLKSFKFIKVDISNFKRFDKNQKMLKKFNLFGTPLMVFFNRKENISRIY